MKNLAFRIKLREETPLAIIVTAILSLAVFMLLTWVIGGLLINRGENHPSFALVGVLLWAIFFPFPIRITHAVYCSIILMLTGEWDGGQR